MIAAVRKFEISPENQTSGNNSYSYRNGNPIIQFRIAENEYYLRSKNIKLCFDVRLVQVDAAGATSFPNNNNQSTVPPAAAGEVRLNSRTGVASLFEQLEINNSMNLLYLQTNKYKVDTVMLLCHAQCQFFQACLWKAETSLCPEIMVLGVVCLNSL